MLYEVCIYSSFLPNCSNYCRFCGLINFSSILVTIHKIPKDKPIFGSPDQGALKPSCPDPRMSFSGISNNQHCEGLLVFVTNNALFVALLTFIVQSEKTCFVFHPKNSLTINKKYA